MERAQLLYLDGDMDRQQYLRIREAARNALGGVVKVI